MMRLFRSVVILSAVLALVLAWPVEPLLAQSSAGSISGTIVDAAGGPLPGTSVTARIPHVLGAIAPSIRSASDWRTSTASASTVRPTATAT